MNHYNVYKSGTLIAKNIRQKQVMNLTGIKSFGNIAAYIERETLYKGIYKIELADDDCTEEQIEELKHICLLFATKCSSKTLSNIKFVGKEYKA